MSGTLYAFGIVAALGVLVVMFVLLRRGTLRERHAVWWFVAGVLALVIAVFPDVLTWAARIIGVEVPANLIFFVAIAILVLLSLQHSAELTRAEDRIRTLTERVAMLDLRLREVETESEREQRDGEG